MNFGYERYNVEENTLAKKRICGYFVVSDLHKVTPVDVRLRTEELVEEIAKHEDWVLESIVWDANHRVDTNREGLNIILEKAANDEFDILLLRQVTLLSRQGGKIFDYAVRLYKLGKSVCCINDGIYTIDRLADSLHISVSRRKGLEELNKQPEWEGLTPEEKKKQLFLNQKKLLDTFLEKNAISKAQYDKSLGDLRDKMGMHGVD